MSRTELGKTTELGEKIRQDQEIETKEANRIEKENSEKALGIVHIIEGLPAERGREIIQRVLWHIKDNSKIQSGENVDFSYLPISSLTGNGSVL